MTKKYNLNITVEMQEHDDPEETREASIPITITSENESLDGFCGEVAMTMAMMWQSFKNGIMPGEQNPNQDPKQKASHRNKKSNQHMH